MAGTHADNLGYQCGGWTITWQGFSGNNDTSGMCNFKILNVFLLLLYFSNYCEEGPQNSFHFLGDYKRYVKIRWQLG